MLSHESALVERKERNSFFFHKQFQWNFMAYSPSVLRISFYLKLTLYCFHRWKIKWLGRTSDVDIFILSLCLFMNTFCFCLFLCFPVTFANSVHVSLRIFGTPVASVIVKLSLSYRILWYCYLEQWKIFIIFSEYSFPKMVSLMPTYLEVYPELVFYSEFSDSNKRYTLIFFYK